jgi:hypothetical protein
MAALSIGAGTNEKDGMRASRTMLGAFLDDYCGNEWGLWRGSSRATFLGMQPAAPTSRGLTASVSSPTR